MPEEALIEKITSLTTLLPQTIMALHLAQTMTCLALSLFLFSLLKEKSEAAQSALHS